jgi:hypothetical protein
MPREPWKVLGVPWKTESSFWGWVRGVLRKGWSKHPVKLEYIKQHRKRIKNPNPKGKVSEVWGMICQQCKCEVIQSNIEIDHIGANSSFTGLHDAESYMKHLFLVDFESLESCCKSCHSIRSHMQNKGVSFEEAAMLKEVIRIFKEESLEDVLDFIAAHDYNNEYAVNNAVNRKAAVRLILESVN